MVNNNSVNSLFLGEISEVADTLPAGARRAIRIRQKLTPTEVWLKNQREKEEDVKIEVKEEPQEF